jgi:hypothetical protein
MGLEMKNFLEFSMELLKKIRGQSSFLEVLNLLHP